MVKNSKKLREFEKNFLKSQTVNIKQNFNIIEGLFREAISLGVIPIKNPLDGIEIDIKVARAINSVSKTS